MSVREHDNADGGNDMITEIKKKPPEPGVTGNKA